jgi:hypothetical protein
VNGNADFAVLLENDDVVTTGGKDASGRQSRGTGADDCNVTHDVRSVLASAHFPCAQQANPK